MPETKTHYQPDTITLEPPRRELFSAVTIDEERCPDCHGEGCSPDGESRCDNPECHHGRIAIVVQPRPISEESLELIPHTAEISR